MPGLATREEWSDARPRRPQPNALPRGSARAWNVDVLLVEDDRADATLILDILRRNPQVGRVHNSAAPDGVLFDLASDRLRPRLVLFDIHMPKVNGFQFLKALRQIPRMRETPVVFLTTSRLERDFEKAKASTASLFVVKPDSYDEFQTRLESVIDQAVTGLWSKMT